MAHRCVFNVLEERHHDFRDQWPGVDPNAVVQPQAFSQVSHDHHGIAQLDRQRCCSFQFLKFYHADCMVTHLSAKCVVVEPMTAPKHLWCAEEERESVSAVSESDESSSSPSETSDASDEEDADIVGINGLFLGEDGEAKLEDPAKGGESIVMKAFQRSTSGFSSRTRSSRRHAGTKIESVRGRDADLFERRCSWMCQAASTRGVRSGRWWLGGAGQWPMMALRVGRIMRVRSCSRRSLSKRCVL